MNESDNSIIKLGSGATAWNPCMLGSHTIGDGTNIGALSHIGKNVIIGKNCRIQGSVYIADGSEIGNDVFIGPNATITNDRHPPSRGDWSPVIVEDGVVIGANATIVAGATLRKDCVVGAGSVVISDIPKDEVWVGNPAKFLMSRIEYETRRS